MMLVHISYTTHDRYWGCQQRREGGREGGREEGEREEKR